ncbi:MAG: hypothetical protein IT169_16170 [Bryobacterales bacterium]|nr:hypothetical protein [Bryobacterales bacterium]
MAHPMIHALLDRVTPASLYRNGTSFTELRALDELLHGLNRCDDAISLLESARDRLRRLLARRFDETTAQALTLKALNILLAKYQFRARHSHLAAHPVGLVVDPSNMCQLGCPGCVHSSSPGAAERFAWPNGTLPESRFRALMERYGPTAVAVYFCDYGEPLLNRNTPALARIAKSYRMQAMLSTSLSVRQIDAEALVDSGLDFMVLSIDGATQPVYERFRRGGRLDLVFENIRKLVAARNRMGRSTPILSWNFLAFQHNVHEIPEALRVARRLGVDQFRVVEPFDVSWDDPGIQPARVKPRVVHLTWAPRRIFRASQGAASYPLDAERIGSAYETPWERPPEQESIARSSHACHWLYKNLVMDATGRVMPCCAAPTPSNHLVFTEFGGASGDPFNSPKHWQARALFAGNADRKPDAAERTGASIPCSNCEWDQTKVNIGAREIERYFRQTDPMIFDARARRLLSQW